MAKGPITVDVKIGNNAKMIDMCRHAIVAGGIVVLSTLGALAMCWAIEESPAPPIFAIAVVYALELRKMYLAYEDIIDSVNTDTD